MKKTIIIALSILLLSACGVKTEVKQKVLDKVEEKIAEEQSELAKEATSDSDKALLDAFSKDKDTDFSSELNQLNTDLQ